MPSNEEVAEGEEVDWCDAARKRVEDGSDGLWLRFGPPVSDTLLSKWFSIRLNPCVSLCSTLALFTFVAFCMIITPGPYCMQATTVTENRTQNHADLDAGYTSVTNYGMVAINEYKWSVTKQVLQDNDCYAPGIEFRYWRKWVTKVWTWLYIVTQDAWIIFLFVVLLSKYSSLKIGKDDDVPDFTSAEWFSMIFCCGVATGLFYFSVGEPINHYEPCGKWAWSGAPANPLCKTDGSWANRYSHLTDNERAQEAMNLTFYHWGLHGWVCYAVVGVLLGILHFRKGLPMTMKTCFYPLVGERIYGFWGDFIDVLSVVCTTFGVCTSLGLGTMQINAGIKRLNSGKNWMGMGWYGTSNYDDWKDNMDSYKTFYDSAPVAWRSLSANAWGNVTGAKVAQVVKDNDQQIMLIWMITAVSTLSVCMGLQTGIKYFSLLAFIMGMFLLWVILAMDDTWFLMNLFVQSLGHYIQYFFQVGFYTGAFDQTIDGAPDTRQEYSGWMDDWTIFYWGWWISWAPFVGVFLARISKGRTVREFIIVALVLTVGYNFAWMTIWGGAALKMEMAAAKAGVTCADLPYAKNYCRLENNIRGMGVGRFNTEPEWFCSTVTRLSCHYFDYPPMIFDVLDQYANLGPFLSVVALITVILYFVTSSDSGSMVDDMVTANGIEEPPLAQRIWWAFTEGLAATGLMYMGRFDPSTPNASLKALQAASIAAGLPYTILVCLMCVALWRTLQYEFKDRKWGSGFKSSCIDVGITLYTCKPGTSLVWNMGPPVFNKDLLKTIVTFTLAPFLGLMPAMTKLDEIKSERKKLEAIRSKSTGRSAMVVAVTVGGLLFYAGWFLVFLDYLGIDAGGYNTYGKMKSDYSSMEEYKVSNRFGYFRIYKNDWDTNSMLQPATDLYTTHLESVATGDRFGPPGTLSTIGWFFILLLSFVVCALRSNTREVYKIPGNLIEDYFCSLIFYGGVLKQVNDTLASPPPEDGANGGDSYSKSGEGSSKTRDLAYPSGSI